MAFDRPTARGLALAPPRAPRPGRRGARRAAPALAAAILAGLPLFGAIVPARAQQQGGEWFVPGQGGAQQQRPGQPTQPAQAGQRPPQGGAQQQRPATQPGRQPPAPVIGIVDVPEVQRESAAFTQVREEIEKRRQKLNDDLQREQTGWRDSQQQLANQRATLPPEQLRQRERDLQDRITESQRIFRERARAVDAAAQQALLEMQQALAVVIRQTAADRNVNMVLPRELVILITDPAFDMTSEVVQRFNRTLRSVTIPPEATLMQQGGAGDTPQAAAQPGGQQPAARPPGAPAGGQPAPAQGQRR